MTPSKKWYQSRTLWSAILKAVSGILASLVLVLNGELSFVDFLPGAVMTVWSAVDAWIRWNTTSSIE